MKIARPVFNGAVFALAASAVTDAFWWRFAWLVWLLAVSHIIDHYEKRPK